MSELYEGYKPLEVELRRKGEALLELNVEFIKQSFEEAFPNARYMERVVLQSVDARNKPPSIDRFLHEIPPDARERVAEISFDPVNLTFTLLCNPDEQAKS